MRVRPEFLPYRVMDEIQNDVCEESIREIGSGEVREWVGYAALYPYDVRVPVDEFKNFREFGLWLAWELHIALVLADFLTGVLLVNRV